MQYILNKRSFHCLKDMLSLHNSASDIFKWDRIHCRETKLFAKIHLHTKKCHFWKFTIPTNFQISCEIVSMTPFDFCKWLNCVFGFNMVAYSKCSNAALGYYYLVSQLTNSVLPVKISVRMLVWCWVDKIIENWLKFKATNMNFVRHSKIVKMSLSESSRSDWLKKV